MFDLIVQNGKIVDGSGRRGYPADIGIKNGFITDISFQLEAEAKEIINAAGCAVSPGFIDMHSHSDFSLLVHPEAESRVRQGITTELVGNCGGSPAPVPVERFKDFMQYMTGLGGLYKKSLAPSDWRWKTLAHFYDDLGKNGIAVNVAPLVGHSTLRAAVMGYEGRPPSSDELNHLKRLLEEALRRKPDLTRSGSPAACLSTLRATASWLDAACCGRFRRATLGCRKSSRSSNLPSLARRESRDAPRRAGSLPSEPGWPARRAKPAPPVPRRRQSAHPRSFPGSLRPTLPRASAAVG